MKLYYFESLNPRKACAVAKHLGSPVDWRARLNELPAWREPFPAPPKAAAA